MFAGLNCIAGGLAPGAGCDWDAVASLKHAIDTLLSWHQICPGRSSGERENISMQKYITVSGTSETRH